MIYKWWAGSLLIAGDPVYILLGYILELKSHEDLFNIFLLYIRDAPETARYHDSSYYWDYQSPKR